MSDFGRQPSHHSSLDTELNSLASWELRDLPFTRAGLAPRVRLLLTLEIVVSPQSWLSVYRFVSRTQQARRSVPSDVAIVSLPLER